MYAEITLYDDDGTIKNKRPYVVPAGRIDVFPSDQVGGERTVEYKFTFVLAERIPTDPREIDVLNKIERAYKEGYAEGRESVEYYARGRKLND